MNINQPRLYFGSNFLPPMTTYAQNFEDVYLRRALIDIDRGFYIDIGAFHPLSHSVTQHFYSQGWSGINIEPNLKMFKNFVSMRTLDINLNVGVGSQSGEGKLWVVGDTGLTSTVKEVAESAKARGYEITDVAKIRILNLAEVLSYANGREVDFLKIDVEGAESEIVGAYDFVKVRPRVLVIENSEGAHQHVIRCRYIFAWFDGLNRYYVRDEDDFRCDALARPPSIYDSIQNLNRPWP